MIFILVTHYSNSGGNIGSHNANADSTSVDITGLDWEETYTVIVEVKANHLSDATGDEQEGACVDNRHTASVTVDAPPTTASIDLGQDIAPSVTNMLRAYSRYIFHYCCVQQCRR